MQVWNQHMPRDPDSIEDGEVRPVIVRVVTDQGERWLAGDLHKWRGWHMYVLLDDIGPVWMKPVDVYNNPEAAAQLRYSGPV